MADDLISRQTIGRSGSMTNEEAIKLLSQIKDVLLASNSWLPSTHNPIKESFGMAINALTAQEKAQEVSNNSPELDKENGELISRQAAIDACLELLETRRKWDTAEGRAEMRGINPVMCAIHDLPSAQPYTDEEIQAMQDLEQAQLDKAYELGWQEGREAFRQEAIDAVEESRLLNHHQDGKEACAHEYEHRHFLKLLRDLPSSQPDPCEDVVSREYLTEHIEACWMNGRMSKPDLNEVLSWINDVPSAQPVEKDINVPVKDLIKGEPMSDLISTQEAVAKIVDTSIRKILSGEQKLTKEYEQSVKDAVNVILNTARREAQADIVRCKDCKHRIEHKHYGDLGKSAYTCEGNMVGWILPDDFCSWAERRTDEAD